MYVMRACSLWIVILLIAALEARPSLGQTIHANGIALSPEVTNVDDLAALVSEAKAARIVHLRGDAEGAFDQLHRAQKQVVQLLHEQAGYDVLVLPVGIYEGAWVGERLLEGVALADAAQPLYRVWRESATFMDILRYLQTQGNDIAVIGGLSRYHATGKELYAPHLIQFFDAVRPDLLSPSQRAQIETVLGGRDRLSRDSVAVREQAAALVKDLIRAFLGAQGEIEAHYGVRRAGLEGQFLRNMQTFIELEQLRAGDIPDDATFAMREKQQNLDWMLSHRFYDRKIIYWEGRGAGTDPLPTTAPVFVITLTVSE